MLRFIFIVYINIRFSENSSSLEVIDIPEKLQLELNELQLESDLRSL
jgi:hypothetical protein